MATNINQPPLEKRFASPWELQLLDVINDLEKKATTDTLTGLYNVNFWHDLLPKLEASNRLGFVITSIDLDNLKITNDTHGHPAGDQSIVDTSNVIKKSFRSEDTIIRTGGDEFTVILQFDPDKLKDEHQNYLTANNVQPQISLDEYVNNNISNRLSANIAAFNENLPEGSFPIKISFGSQISLPDKDKIPPHNLTDTFNKADGKMYQMKQEHKSSSEQPNLLK